MRSVLCAVLLMLTVHNSAAATSGDVTARVATRLTQLPGVNRIVMTAFGLGLAGAIACTSGCDTDLGNQLGKVLSPDGDSSDVNIGMSYHGPNFNASVNGARLAIAQLNHSGGVHGNELVLLPRNNLGDASTILGWQRN